MKEYTYLHLCHSLLVVSVSVNVNHQFSILCSFLQFIQNFVNETFLERWGIQLGVYEVKVCPVMFLFPRKKTMLLNNVFLLSSSLLALLSRTAKSFEMIIISRFLVGINAGTVYTFYLQMQFRLCSLYFLPLRLLVSSCYYYKPSSLFLFRHQYECTAHVFW